MITATVLAWATLALAPPGSLADAQRQEVALLEAERDALNDALAEADTAGKTATRALQSEIDGMTTQLAALQADNATHARKLPERERARTVEVQARQLDALLGQLTTWLSLRGVVVPPQGGPAALPTRIEAVLDTIAAEASLRIEPGASYFTTEGDVATADVLRVGSLAAVRWDGEATPLVATADGLLALAGLPAVREPAGPGLRVGIVLHDPDAPADPRAYLEPSWRQTMQDGGPLMWVLLVFGTLASVIALERTVVLLGMARSWRAIVRRLDALHGASPAAWVQQLERERSVLAQPLVVVLQAGDSGRSDVEDRATQAVLQIRDRLLSRLSILGLVAAVAPLLGLLGTVTGMIKTFSVVTAVGTSDPQALAGGISEALLTTQFGLAVAIPAVIVHALLGRAARRVLSSVEQTVLRHIHGVVHPDHDHDHQPEACQDDFVPAPTPEA